MKNIIKVGIVFSVSLLAACKSNDAITSTEREGYRCEKVRLLGTNIPTKRCTSAWVRRQELEYAREQVANSQRAVLSGKDF